MKLVIVVPMLNEERAIATTPSVRALARRFGVSREALVYALMSGGKIDQVRR